MLQTRIALTTAALLIGLQAAAIGHSGRTNAQGCHNDNINGGYHCHNGGSSGSGGGSGGSSGGSRSPGGSSSGSSGGGSGACPNTAADLNGVTTASAPLMTGTTDASTVIATLPAGESVTIHSWQMDADGTRWAWLTTTNGQSAWSYAPLVDCIR